MSPLGDNEINDMKAAMMMVCGCYSSYDDEAM